MKSLRSYLLESNFSPRFVRAVFSALPLIEACNINKDFLIKEAGSPENFAEAKARVQDLWKRETMDQQLNQKTGQKVLNLLYLMEIRQPGFTTADKLHRIHDLALANLLDTKFLNMVSSDTTPGEADSLLADAEERKARNDKLYPDLTDEEEKVWNRVKVYHEFPDGFKWVYAVDDVGNIVSSMPSTITMKTMNHCGNSPRANTDDQYWELRGPDGKAYLTVILDSNDRVEESKSWGNRSNKYRTMIQPYVKWFLLNKANGVGPRYNYGYSTETNYGVKDFIVEDPEFVDYVMENKPELVGNSEGRILFWKGALEDGVLDVDGIKRLYAQKVTFDDLDRAISEYSGRSRFGKYITGDPKEDLAAIRSRGWGDTSLFGHNGFSIVCAACGGCPFSRDELKQMIANGSLGLEEFANYDIKLLDDDMQSAFVRKSPNNMHTLAEIAKQVATFKVSDDTLTVMHDIAMDPVFAHSGDRPDWGQPGCEEYFRKLNRWEAAVDGMLDYLAGANPPEKVRDKASDWIPELVPMICKTDNLRRSSNKLKLLETFARFPDLPVPVPELFWRGIREMIRAGIYIYTDPMPIIIEIGRPRIDPLFSGMTPSEMVKLCQAKTRSSTAKLDSRNIVETCMNLGGLTGQYPELVPLLKKTRNLAVKLGMYCYGGEGICTHDEALAIAKAIIDGDEAEKAKLSARAAMAIVALSRMAELREELGGEKVLWYLSTHAAEINNTFGAWNNFLLTPALCEYVLDTMDRMTDGQHHQEDLGWHYRQNLAVLDLFRSRMKGFDDRFRNIYNRLFYINSGSMPVSKVQAGIVKIPYDEWDRYAERMGKFDFIDRYVTESPWRYESEMPDYPVNYMLDYLIEEFPHREDDYNARWRMKRIATSQAFRSRRLFARAKELLASRIESGDIRPTRNMLAYFNEIGLLTKAQVAKFSSAITSDELTSGGIDSVTGYDDVKKLTDSLDSLLGSPRMPKLIDEMFGYWADPETQLEQGNPIIKLGLVAKLAKWCTRNCKKPGVAEGVQPDKINAIVGRLREYLHAVSERYRRKSGHWESNVYMASCYGSTQDEAMDYRLNHETLPDTIAALQKCMERCGKHRPQTSLKL